ncbi:hypothetical protein HKCCE4037_19130 [Rhodobacterales bacterium HKCCE4037]|nr:hypothetical protein [Rhodobacterales bacterium HKCCE4037]
MKFRSKKGCLTMTKPLKKAFNLNASEESDKIRDKDNADAKIPPPKYSHRPAPNLAPTGSGGIKRGLPSKTNAAQEPERSPFTLGEKGKLVKEFKPLAKPGKDHGHEH